METEVISDALIWMARSKIVLYRSLCMQMHAYCIYMPSWHFDCVFDRMILLKDNKEINHTIPVIVEMLPRSVAKVDGDGGDYPMYFFFYLYLVFFYLY